MKLKAVLLSAALTVFVALTFTGAGYVLYNGGRVSAGYAVIPYLFFVVALLVYKKQRVKK